MSTPNNVRLCEASTILEQDWRTIYETAFPAGEREPESRLQQLINDGKLLYHKTIGKNGELLCFSMVSLAPDFSFLAYIATDPNQRSGGYGSKHMKALVDLLKQTYPAHVGMFLEIDSTAPKKSLLSAEEKTIRLRRLGFYKRLGSKRLCRTMNYRAPSRNGDGTEQEFDLLFFNFTANPINHAEKARIVSDIYERFYGLLPGDTLVASVTAEARGCSHQQCEDDPDTTNGGNGSSPGRDTNPSETKPVEPEKTPKGSTGDAAA